MIDVFAKNLKHILLKEFLDKKNTKWINLLPGIIERYNNTPHLVLSDITPNQAISDTQKKESCISLEAEGSGYTTLLYLKQRVMDLQQI